MANFEWCWRILNLSFVIFKMNKLWMYNLRMSWVTGDDESRVAPVRAGDTGWRNFAAFGILWSRARGTPTRSRGWRDFSVNTWVCWRDLESMGCYTIRWYVIVMDSEFDYFCCATAPSSDSWTEQMCCKPLSFAETLCRNWRPYIGRSAWDVMILIHNVKHFETRDTNICKLDISCFEVSTFSGCCPGVVSLSQSQPLF